MFIEGPPGKGQRAATLLSPQRQCAIPSATLLTVTYSVSLTLEQCLTADWYSIHEVWAQGQIDKDTRTMVCIQEPSVFRCVHIANMQLQLRKWFALYKSAKLNNVHLWRSGQLSFWSTDFDLIYGSIWFLVMKT